MGRYGVTASGVSITLSRVDDLAALGSRWRELETRAEPSFFQTWTWMGCLVEERFPDPVLAEAREDGRVVALALFNRRGASFYLGESGDLGRDTIYIEFNGVMCETGREAELTSACIRAARGWSGFLPNVPRWSALVGTSRLVLSGIDMTAAAAVARTGYFRVARSQIAPHATLNDADGDFLDRRSANTRAQIRRSDRVFAALGSIAVTRAETPDQALAFLDELGVLHQRTWTSRQRPGAFASPFFIRFHRALIEAGAPRREIDLLRVSCGSHIIGFLYNFRYRGRSLAYQSGFDYALGGRHGKPGLTCHHQAIRYLACLGVTRYDFLAGDDRYKRSLADGTETLYWIEAGGRFSPRFLAWRARDWLARPAGQMNGLSSETEL